MTTNAKGVLASAVTQSYGASTATLVYPNTGTGNATATNCKLYNKEGWPNFVLFSHNTVAAGDNLRSALQISRGIYPRNITYTSNLITSLSAQSDNQQGWFTSQSTEGTPSINFYDTSTLALNNDVLVNRVPSRYTEYPSGKSPPTTIYFPTNGYSAAPGTVCTVSPPDVNCIGWKGFQMGATYPPVNFTSTYDYHNFILCGDPGSSCPGPSKFANGQPFASTLGTQQNPSWKSMGADINAIDAAQNLNTYVCLTSCGTGPYPLK
jgi:hypothetical protein